jgi:hypothetical protein
MLLMLALAGCTSAAQLSHFFPICQLDGQPPVLCSANAQQIGACHEQ